MNVFEDLIEELKEEHLLEETVIETQSKKHSFESDLDSRMPETGHRRDSQNSSVFDSNHPIAVSEFATVPALLTESFETVTMPLAELDGIAEIVSPDSAEPDANDALEISLPKPKTEPGAKMSANFPAAFEYEVRRPLVNEKEYFKKRAIDEVAGLQMVEHVLSGVEREQMKLIPRPFNDIPVKKALHDFIQAADDTKSPEHARAEFRLMQETESWYSSLSYRDKHISVAHLRRFCETTKPSLSPQALIAMGRFYRNSPFSEQIRNKFDLIMTRLFAKECGHDKRELLFSREELTLQIKDLYADWSSIQVYTADEDDSDILISVMKFQDFVVGAEDTDSFDELITSNFFNRLRLFKESCNENFFAPLITVASVEANILIGNRYVELIEKERNSVNSSILEEKYGFLHDQAISDSTGKTFQMVELLKERTVDEKTDQTEIVGIQVKVDAPPSVNVTAPRSRIFSVNKWLLGLTITTVVACGGLYFWAESKSQEVVTTQSAKVIKVNLENSSLKEFLQTARINEETFYGITLNSWDDLNLERKEDVLRKIQAIGKEKGFTKVHLINEKGKSVGFASAEKAEVYNP